VRAIMIMFDSLNRRMLSPYGCDWTHTPNFDRLNSHAVRFDNCYAGSLPCMPARRELHTGRYNFLHRSWGPIEPFDDSMPEILKDHGIASHLVSDHYHYWEDGGCTYHTRFSNWRFSRGQEGDPWRGDRQMPPGEAPNALRSGAGKGKLSTAMQQDWINRSYIKTEEDWPQAKTFQMGLEFLEKNHDQQDWYLQLETFDPHEPYFVPEKYRKLYEDNYAGPEIDWPLYKRVEEKDRHLVKHFRALSAALHSMCDEYLGKVMDFMDAHDMWKDTLLIVNTDHGFLLGEHGWWAKCAMPFYNEIAHTPLFVWDPRCGCKGKSRKSLVQSMDLPATILEFFGLQAPESFQGQTLRDTVASDTPVREAGLYGMLGGHVNYTDGRYVYMRAPLNPENAPLHEYTLMPTQHGWGRSFIDLDRLRSAVMAPPFSFTKGCPVMKVPSRKQYRAHEFGTLLFDLEQDPNQELPLDNPELEKKMCVRMTALMQASDAPVEQYERLGLQAFGSIN
jgi:arylsulfatase A-like enzyme